LALTLACDYIKWGFLAESTKVQLTKSDKSQDEILLYADKVD